MMKKGSVEFIQILCASWFLSYGCQTLAHPSSNAYLDQLSHRVEADANNQSLYIERSLVLLNDKHFTLALRDMQRASQLGTPENVDLAFGRYYYAVEKYSKAEFYLSRHLESSPDDVNAIEYRALSFNKQNKLKDAIADYRRLLRLKDKPSPGSYIAASAILEKINGEGIPSALILLDEGLEKLNNPPQLQRRAIELEIAFGHIDRALKRQVMLGETLNHSLLWRVEMADLQRSRGDLGGAASNYKKALDTMMNRRQNPTTETLKARIKRALIQINALSSRPE